MKSFWDNCSSHVLISTRLAAELILEGKRWKRDVYLPTKQGSIWTGAITTRIWADLQIVHRGRRIKVEDCQFYVWDMGRDVTLSCAFLDAYHLQEWQGDPEDDAVLRQLATASTSWATASQELESTRAHIGGQRQGVDVGQGIVVVCVYYEHRNPLRSKLCIAKRCNLNLWV